MADDPITFTARQNLVACGANDVDSFNEETSAQRLARDLFEDAFESCKDKSFEDLDSDFKTCSELTQAQGQVRLLPGVKQRIKAFAHWVCDEFQMGGDPAITLFPVGDTALTIRRGNTLSLHIKRSKEASSAAKPEKFTSTTKWEDWNPTFLNCLSTMPGRDGTPLSYAVRDNQEPIWDPTEDMLEGHVNAASLIG